MGFGWVAALRLISHTGTSVVNCNSAIVACSRDGQWARAVSLLCSMASRRVAPDAVSWSAAIAACGRCSIWAQALALYTSRATASERVALTALVGAYASASLWQKAQALLASAQSHFITLDAVCYLVALTGCARAAEWRCAIVNLDVLRLLPSTNTSRATATAATVAACAAATKWRVALELVSASATGSCVKERSVIAVALGNMVGACEYASQGRAVAAAIFKLASNVCHTFNVCGEAFSNDFGSRQCIINGDLAQILLLASNRLRVGCSIDGNSRLIDYFFRMLSRALLLPLVVVLASAEEPSAHNQGPGTAQMRRRLLIPLSTASFVVDTCLAREVLEALGKCAPSACSAWGTAGRVWRVLPLEEIKATSARAKVDDKTMSGDGGDATMDHRGATVAARKVIVWLSYRLATREFAACSAGALIHGSAR